MHRYEKIAIFDQHLVLSRNWYKIGTYLLWNANRNSYAIYLMVLFSLTFSDLAKYSVTRSIASPLWDSWASCRSWLVKMRNHVCKAGGRVAEAWGDRHVDWTRKLADIYILLNELAGFVERKFWKFALKRVHFRAIWILDASGFRISESWRPIYCWFGRVRR